MNAGVGKWLRREHGNVLEVQALSGEAWEQSIPSGISFRVAAGGHLVLTGLDASQATELCDMIRGIRHPLGGRIWMNRELLHLLPTHERIRRGLRVLSDPGIVFHDMTLSEHVLAANLASLQPLSLLRSLQTDELAAANELLEIVGLECEASRQVADVSFASQRRLQLAMALVGGPSLLVMNSPLSQHTDAQAEVLLSMLRELTAHLAILIIDAHPSRYAGYYEEVLELSVIESAHSSFASAQETEASRDVARSAPMEVDATESVLRVHRPSLDHDGSELSRTPRLEHRCDTTPSKPLTVVQTSSSTASAAVHPPHPAHGVAYVVGTFDTKARELLFVAQCLERASLRVTTVDLSTSGQPSVATISPRAVAAHHPEGAQSVFTGDRGESVSAMAEAFARFLPQQRDVAGVISAGGSGGTALVTPAMQRLDVGVPKVMVSTVASGDVSSYVGPTDICMMYSVTDVQGINRISQQVLSNAANALAGMITRRIASTSSDSKLAIGVTMFGVTTPCVQQVVAELDTDYDCLVFHATGTGGQSMEKLVDCGMLSGVIDATTTEVADLLFGGVMSAGEDRLGAIIRTGVPYVGSCGALDMVNFGAIETVPERYQGRNLYKHNAQVTLMRTTPQDNEEIGTWIANKLNQCQGPVRFLLPQGGVSLIDAPSMPFYDAHSDQALFDAIERTLVQTDNRRLIKTPYNINDPEFSQALVENFHELMKSRQ